MGPLLQSGCVWRAVRDVHVLEDLLEHLRTCCWVRVEYRGTTRYQSHEGDHSSATMKVPLCECS
eukprot:15471746-Alexandrium_andersonii.AAC.1